MKNIVLIFLAAFTLSVSAQEKDMRKERKMKGNDFTPEQMAELQTKKMTLDLDLTEKQQKQVYKLNLTDAKERKQFMEKRKAMKEAGKEKKALTKEEAIEELKKNKGRQFDPELVDMFIKVVEEKPDLL